MPFSFDYPSLNKAAAGDLSDTKVDALGRRVFRVDKERSNARDFVRQGGSPTQRGPESFIPFLLEAAKKAGIPPHMATSPAVLKAIVSGGTTDKGGIFGLSDDEYAVFLPETGGKRPADPRLQALAGLRKLQQLGGLQ